MELWLMAEYRVPRKLERDSWMEQERELERGRKKVSVLGDLLCTSCGTPYLKVVHPVQELVHPGLK